MTLQSRFLDFRFLPKIIGFRQKTSKFTGNNWKSKNGSLVTRSLKSYIIAQNFKMIVYG
jgi:hypothetical protein